MNGRVTITRALPAIALSVALLLSAADPVLPALAQDPGTAATPGPAPSDPPVQPPTTLSLDRLRAGIERLLGAVAAASEQQLLDAPPDAPRSLTRKSRRRERRDAEPSTKHRLTLIHTISGGITPKSIVSAQNGKIFAMNMIYGHTITVFNRRYKRTRTIDDSVDLSRFGHRQYTEKVRGAPVEAALNPATRRLYVSNYSMYGPSFNHPGFDLCLESDRIDRSFVYEINTRTLRKTNAIQVGEVPKYLAVSPDGRYLLVGNWCSWDISVVDLRKGKEIRRIDAGVAPRGIAFSPNGRTAYVTLVGEDSILVIDMRRFVVKRSINGIGERPRHLLMSPDGGRLYVTVQGKEGERRVDGSIITYDTRRRRVVARSAPLAEPRTTVLSEDGKSIYVVDYYPGTLVKLRARDLKVLQTVELGYHPIGVTYDNATDKLWVAGYGGQVWVLKDR